MILSQFFTKELFLKKDNQDTFIGIEAFFGIASCYIGENFPLTIALGVLEFL